MHSLVRHDVTFMGVFWVYLITMVFHLHYIKLTATSAARIVINVLKLSILGLDMNAEY